MANLCVLFAVVLSSAFLSTKIMVHGAGEPHPTNASVDITEEMQISRDVSPPNETWSRDSGVLGFPCDSKACLSLCCPLGKAQQNGSCAEDNVASNITLKIRTPMYNDDQEIYADDRDFELLIDDPCAFSWMASWVSEDFYVLPNGTIYAADFEGGSHFDFEHYCLFREPKSTVYSAKVCKQWIEKVNWQILCLIFSGLVMVATLVVYSVVPELRNLHGLVFRSYIIAYICCHFCTIGQQLTSGSRTYTHLFTFFIFGLHYSAGCCALWLNVICFNIWRTFRSLRSVESHNRDRKRKKFIWYVIYACVTPALFNVTTSALMIYVPFFQKLPLNSNIILWGCAGLLTTVVVVNTILYTLTAIRIGQHERDTAHLANGVNKHHYVDKQWFNLHLKLFLVTGSHTIMWVIWELYPTRVTTCIMIVLEVVESILIFVIFVWKSNVKRSLRKQFEVTLSRMKSTFGNDHTTPTTKC